MATNSPTLDSLFQQQQAYTQGATDTASKLSADTDTQQQLAASNALLYGQVGQDSAAISDATTANALNMQARHAMVVANSNMDIEQQGNLITKYTQMASTAQQQKDDALATIQQKHSVSFLDDPIQWISNQFTVNSDIQAHNDANHRLNSANNAIEYLNNNTQQTQLTQDGMNAPMTLVSAQAASDAALASAQVNSNQAAIQGLGYNLAGLKDAMQISNQDLDFAYKAQNVEQQQVNTGIALAHLKLAQDRFDWEKEKQDIDKGGVEAFGDQVIKYSEIGKQIRMGANYVPSTPDEITSPLKMIKAKGALSTIIQQDYQTGQLNTTAGKNDMLGASPSQVYNTVNNTKGIPYNISPEKKPLMDIINTAAGDVHQVVDGIQNAAVNIQNTPILAGVNRKDPQSISTAIDGLAQQYYNKAVAGDSTNSANPANVGNIAMSMSPLPEIQKLPLWQKVFAAPAAAGSVITMDKAVSMVTSAYNAGTISSDEAGQLSTIGARATEMNNSTKGITGFGLVPSAALNVPMANLSGSANNIKLVNVNNQQEFLRALAKQQVLSLVNTYGNFTPGTINTQ